ncbi:MAG: uracil-DNA glycosylase [Burkholderiales bacterium]|jgi:uracil-DNA glycosylase family 4
MSTVNHHFSEMFSPDCSKCPRLADFLAQARHKYPSYYARPVPSFGPTDARLLIVGLAPGLHGANRTGRPFTGDHAGLLLYRTLFEYGFANAAESVSADDGLQLLDCRITNAVRCVPPQNKPTLPEVKQCNGYLRQELSMLEAGGVVLALGSVAHTAVLRALGLRLADYRFGHAAEHLLPGAVSLIDSYHCSRYNTQTRRLTETMFRDVFTRVRALIEQPPSTHQRSAS